MISGKKAPIIASVSAALVTLVATSASAAGMSCESLSGLKLRDTTITTAESVAAGAFTPPRQNARPVPVAFCRVAGSIKPTSDSDIKFEVWLPEPSKWTGRYESVGNGGFAGSIRYDSMLNPLLGGTAVASTDDGHSGPGATWALGHPEKVADYGYRAVHVTADTSKAITKAYYGNAPKYSYFVGCSKGGGEGHMEAQRFPDDFDGIVVMAPANRFPALFSSFAWAQSLNLSDKAGYLSAADIERVGPAVVNACDAADGVKDGLITNPLTCSPSAEALGLTPAQYKTYMTIREGAKTRDGKQFYPGQPYGAEVVGWRSTVTGPSFEEARARASWSTYANGFFANMVYSDPNWDFKNFDLEKGAADAEKAVGKVLRADDVHYAEFRSRDGKILQLDGWADALVTPLGSIDFYSKVVAAEAAKGRRSGTSGAARGLDPAALAKTQEWYRLFLAPGVGHCGGGPGPNQFGQAGGNGDAQHDAVVAMYQWVEKGIAPSQIIATKYVDDSRDKGVAMTRPLCMYPQVAKYKGSGDTNVAANFVCAVE
jgi:feruloyl esterase